MRPEDEQQAVASVAPSGLGAVGSVINGALNLYLSDQKREEEKRQRQEEVERLEKRENTQYSRSIADMMRAGYDPRAGQTNPPPASVASVAPQVSPDYAASVSEGVTSGLGVGSAEAGVLQRQQELDQAQENNEWTITGNMFQNLRQSIDDDMALAQNDEQYYHGRYVELRKFVSETLEVGDETATRTFDQYTDAWEKKKNELLSQRHNVTASISAGSQSSRSKGSEHQNGTNTGSETRQSEKDAVNAFTGEVAGETIENSSSSSQSSSILDKLTDVAKKVVSFGGSLTYGYQHLTEEEKSELAKWSHEWLSENLGKQSKTFKGLSPEDKQKIVQLITETYVNYSEARDYNVSVKDRKWELYRIIGEQYDSHQSHRYRSPRGSRVYLNKQTSNSYE